MGKKGEGAGGIGERKKERVKNQASYHNISTNKRTLTDMYKSL